MKHPLMASAFLILLAAPVEIRAGVESVEIGTVQVSRSLSGVVRDQTGTAIKNVLVEECSANWQKCVAETRTDPRGFFSFKSANKQKIHFLRVSMDLFNPVLMRVRLSKWTRKQLKMVLPVST